jgi:hypothetical protein
MSSQFPGLNKVVNALENKKKFLTEVRPFIQGLAREFDTLFDPECHGICQWEKFRGKDDSTMYERVALSYKQCACILANMFLGRLHERENFPVRNMRALSKSEKPSACAKLYSVVSYFTTLYNYPGLLNGSNKGIVIERNTHNEKCSTFSGKDPEMSNFSWDDNEAQGSPSLSSSHRDCAHVCFTNPSMGSGFLALGGIDEGETFLMSYPEALAAVAVCRDTLPHESVTIAGARKFCITDQRVLQRNLMTTTGSNREDTSDDSNDFCAGIRAVVPSDQAKTRVRMTPSVPPQLFCCTSNLMIALDAMPINRPDGKRNKHNFSRDLTKAYTGFSSPLVQELGKRTVVTGNWGCDTKMGGSQQDAIMTQWAAASYAGVGITYDGGGPSTALFREKLFPVLSGVTVKEALQSVYQEQYKERYKAHTAKGTPPKTHMVNENSQKEHVPSKEGPPKPHTAKGNPPKPHTARENSPKLQTAKGNPLKLHMFKEDQPKEPTAHEDQPKPHTAKGNPPKEHVPREEDRPKVHMVSENLQKKPTAHENPPQKERAPKEENRPKVHTAKGNPRILHMVNENPQKLQTAKENPLKPHVSKEDQPKVHMVVDGGPQKLHTANKNQMELSSSSDDRGERSRDKTHSACDDDRSRCSFSPSRVFSVESVAPSRPKIPLVEYVAPRCSLSPSPSRRKSSHSYDFRMFAPHNPHNKHTMPARKPASHF